eukprot:12869806-Alexandrium_andersonii.AAC.1
MCIRDRARGHPSPGRLLAGVRSPPRALLQPQGQPAPRRCQVHGGQVRLGRASGPRGTAVRPRAVRGPCRR